MRFFRRTTVDWLKSGICQGCGFSLEPRAGCKAQREEDFISSMEWDKRWVSMVNQDTPEQRGERQLCACCETWELASAVACPFPRPHASQCTAEHKWMGLWAAWSKTTVCLVKPSAPCVVVMGIALCAVLGQVSSQNIWKPIFALHLMTL